MTAEVQGLPCKAIKMALSLLAMLLASVSVQADWVELNKFNGIAEFSVTSGEIRLGLRLAESAVPVGADLSAKPTASPPNWLVVRLPTILAKNNQPLAGRMLSLEHMADNATAMTGTNNGGNAYYEATLVYPIDERLEKLTIIPPEGEAIGLVLLHRGVPVTDLMPLKNKVNLNLDWNDPWRTRFDEPEFARRHAEPRSYLYVESYEVRQELLLPLKDLKPWLDFGLRDGQYVEEDEREALKEKIGAFLLGRNPLRIDGANASPQLDRVEFVCFDRSGVVPVGQQGRLETASILVGVMLAYLTDHPARSLHLQWDLFGASSSERQVSLIRGKESFDAYMILKQPYFDWSQEDTFDLGSIGKEASELMVPIQNAQAPAKLDETQMKTLLQSLLHNAYRAFQMRDEEKAYDRLTQSLDGDLLDDMYLQQRKAMLRQAKGLGGEGQVDRVEVLETHTQSLGQQPGALQVTSRWLAHGTVSHWGHSHERHNLYQARLMLKNFKQGGWKIVGMEFLDGQSLEYGAS